jgi:hypothetical protein
LQEFLLLPGRGTPHIFKDFVRLEEFGVVEERNATEEAVGIHGFHFGIAGPRPARQLIAR